MLVRTCNVVHLQAYPLSSYVIRVTAPQLSKFDTAIQLDQQLTAGDIIERFTSFSRSPVDGARFTSFCVCTTEAVSFRLSVNVVFIT